MCRFAHEGGGGGGGGGYDDHGGGGGGYRGRSRSPLRSGGYDDRHGGGSGGGGYDDLPCSDFQTVCPRPFFWHDLQGCFFMRASLCVVRVHVLGGRGERSTIGLVTAICGALIPLVPGYLHPR
jgi:hypothetical protein